MKNFLWVEKYRPKKIDDYVFKNEQIEKKIKEFIKNKQIPHLLIFGPPGTGKTSLAKVLLKEIGIGKEDLLEINASLENRIEIIREDITTFITSSGFGKLRCVLLDESDYLSSNSQAGLRYLMENYSKNSRFIFTANYVHKIIPAIKSRCQQLNLNKIDEEKFILKGIEILEKEKISYDEEVFIKIFKKSYPDLRKFINNLQMLSCEGVLMSPSDEDLKTTKDFYLDIIENFKKNKIYECRRMIIDNLNPEDYIEFYRFCFDNVKILSKNSLDKEFDIICLIKQYIVDHNICIDPEINLAAFLVELSKIVE